MTKGLKAFGRCVHCLDTATVTVRVPVCQNALLQWTQKSDVEFDLLVDILESEDVIFYHLLFSKSEGEAVLEVNFTLALSTPVHF